MSKVSTDISNNFCPQALFLYGTYKEDKTPDFGLFCWFSYTWDGGLGVMACIGGDKLTKDNIRREGVFSANLINEAMLPLADYYGHVNGYSADKMAKMPKVIPGSVLNVPVIEASPWSFELKVKQEINLNGSDVFLCEVCNVLADEAYTDETKSLEERMHQVAPVVTTHATYFSLFNKQLGAWGEPKNSL